MDAMVTLGVLNPVGGGDPIPLLHEKLLVGRRSSCDISLKFPNVSSHHCELEFTNGYWQVRDLGSRNGVKVNGEKVDSKHLMPGDILHVARHRFEVQYNPTGDGPVPEEENPFSRGLLEKAGLETAPRRPKKKSKTDEGEPAELPPAKKKPKIKSMSEDDFYLEWLGDA